MVASFFITFRESLEASLIVGIILRLNKEKKKTLIAAGLAVLISIIIGIGLHVLLSELETTVEIIEGILMILAAAMITHFLLYSYKHKEYGTWIVFLSVLREGIETVIFLMALHAVAKINYVYAVLGIIAGILVVYFVYEGSLKIDLKKMFMVTSYLLVFISAGLLSHGVHEFEELGFVPETPKVYDAALSEESYVGGLLESLVGYEDNPSIVMFVIYFSYLGVMLLKI